LGQWLPPEALFLLGLERAASNGLASGKLIAKIGLGNAGLCSVSTPLVSRATTATGINFWNCALYSACCWPTVSGSAIPAPIMIVCC